ncbi:MAG TPA: response regulator [Thermoanaerobaculia bacterium]|nr:response regulator [Thermoanaerobaculia bacterium]
MPKKILLADDSITIQKVVELTFSDGDYEVTAVNNGAKAIQKLADMRPDIILSDIIMPEKNGYEVCEFVKSHPEYRTIPVVLLTGTFEPFDPDRADKAGCDAVVTKPFESQSLIHKVEELIATAKSSAATEKVAATPQPAAAAPEPSPWMEEPAAPAPAAAKPPATTPPPAPAVHDNDIFGAPSAEAFSGEKRAFPKMNFDDFPKEPAAAAPSAPASSPWDEQPGFGAQSPETRAFPRMNFDEMQHPSSAAPEESASAPAAETESPFGAPPPADAFSGETRAFPKINFDNVAPPSASAKPPQESAPAADQRPSAPWDEQPAYSGETRAFPQMSFENPDKKVAAPSSSPWDEPAAAAPAWSMREPQPQAKAEAAVEHTPAETAASSNGNGADLTDEQIDRIARRVVQLMSDQVVRNIAWEVIPDLAEMVVKERIRQLETES